MHSIFKRLLALVLMFAMALCVVGCEDLEENDGSKSTNPSSSQPSSSPLPSAPTEPGASRPQFTPDPQQTAYIIGDYQLSGVMLNYFYIDAVINFCNQYSYYIQYLLDINAPLNGASNTDSQGVTWADKFLDMAVSNIKTTYQLYDLAVKSNMKLTDDQVKNIDGIIDSLGTYASYYGFANVDAYLCSTFGAGASVDTYRSYCEVCILADSYYTAYENALAFTDAELRAYEADKYCQYNAYSYQYYYVNAGSFLSNSSNATAEEKAAAVATAKAVAEQLAAGQYATIAEFDAAITSAMQNVTGSTQQYSAVKETDKPYKDINTAHQQWLSGQRKNGDMACIANESGSGDNKTINGYYVVRFESVNEHKEVMKNVRHLLVTFKGNTEAEKTAAKNAALALLAKFEQTDKSESAFAELAKAHTDDGGSKANGGLYENIFPGQMVAPFENWCYEEGRQHGDYGLVETSYGWHIMFFVSDTDMTYRDFMIYSDLKSEALQNWLEDLVENAKTELVTKEYVNLELKIKDL